MIGRDVDHSDFGRPIRVKKLVTANGKLASCEAATWDI